MKIYFTLLLLVLIAGTSLAQTPANAERPELTAKETTETRAIIREFSERVSEAENIGSVIGDLYFSDFIDRYRQEQLAHQPSEGQSAYFVLFNTYRHELLNETETANWRRFYLAATNCWVVGGLIAINQADDGAGSTRLEQTMLPLLEEDPQLAQLFNEEDDPEPIASERELFDRIRLLESFVAKLSADSRTAPLIARGKEKLADFIKTADRRQPWVEVNDVPYFGLAPGARIIYAPTYTGLVIVLAHDGDRLKILWTDLLDE